MGQKQSRVLHGSRSIASNFWLSYAFAKPADFEFPREKELRFCRTVGAMTSLDRELVNSRVPEIAALMYARPSIAVV